MLAYKLPKDEYLVFNARIGHPGANLIRSIRRVPAVHPEGTPTSLFFEKYLHKKSSAIKTEFCYIETDWLKPEELAMVAAVANHTVLFTQKLVGTHSASSIHLVLAQKQEDYYALVDAWANSDKVRREARSAASAIIGEFRCGHRKDLLEVLVLAAADAVSDNLEPYLWNQHILSEGIHTFITSQLTLSYEHYISIESTTPNARREASVRQLHELAREYLCRPKREPLENILRSDLNSLNPDRLSVAFALVHYILETHIDHWDHFLALLKKESIEDAKLKGPEGLWAALLKSISEAFGMTILELDSALQEFAAKHYLYTEEIATLLGVDRECAESSFQGFTKICELKRLKKPVSEKGEKLYQEILGRIDKKLQASAERF